MHRLWMGASAAALILSFGACGDDQTYTARRLVSELNDHGAALELGEELLSSRDGIEPHALRSAEGASGSVTITPDRDAGRAEYERCRSAGPLVCFHAENAV
jgi:hypothetical protein